MIGLFQENGPCTVDSNGNVLNNPYSWSETSNMLYIDQPGKLGRRLSNESSHDTGSSSRLLVLDPRTWIHKSSRWHSCCSVECYMSRRELDSRHLRNVFKACR